MNNRNIRKNPTATETIGGSNCQNTGFTQQETFLDLNPNSGVRTLYTKNFDNMTCYAKGTFGHAWSIQNSAAKGRDYLPLNPINTHMDHIKCLHINDKVFQHIFIFWKSYYCDMYMTQKNRLFMYKKNVKFACKLFGSINMMRKMYMDSLGYIPAWLVTTKPEVAKQQMFSWEKNLKGQFVSTIMSKMGEMIKEDPEQFFHSVSENVDSDTINNLLDDEKVVGSFVKMFKKTNFSSFNDKLSKIASKLTTEDVEEICTAQGIEPSVCKALLFMHKVNTNGLLKTLTEKYGATPIIGTILTKLDTYYDGITATLGFEVSSLLQRLLFSFIFVMVIAIIGLALWGMIEAIMLIVNIIIGEVMGVKVPDIVLPQESAVQQGYGSFIAKAGMLMTMVFSGKVDTKMGMLPFMNFLNSKNVSDTIEGTLMSMYSSFMHAIGLGEYVKLSNDVPVIKEFSAEALAFTAKKDIDSLVAIDHDVGLQAIKLYFESIKIKKLVMDGVLDINTRTEYTTLFNRLEMLYRVACTQGKVTQERVPPKFIMFFGAAGQGKTTLMDLILPIVHTRLGRLDPGNPHYQRKFTKLDVYTRTTAEFWAGYHNQWATTLNELFAAKAPQDNSMVALEVLRMMEDSVYPVNMADVKEKGVTFFTSPLVIGTTNRIHFNNCGMLCPAALERRINYAVNVKRNLDYKFNVEHVINTGSQDDIIDMLKNAWVLTPKTEINTMGMSKHMLALNPDNPEFTAYQLIEWLTDDLIEATKNKRSKQDVASMNWDTIAQNIQPISKRVISDAEVEKSYKDRYHSHIGIADIIREGAEAGVIEREGECLMSGLEKIVGKSQVKADRLKKDCDNISDIAGKVIKQTCSQGVDSILAAFEPKAVQQGYGSYTKQTNASFIGEIVKNIDKDYDAKVECENLQVPNGHYDDTKWLIKFGSTLMLTKAGAMAAYDAGVFSQEQFGNICEPSDVSDNIAMCRRMEKIFLHFGFGINESIAAAYQISLDSYGMSKLCSAILAKEERTIIILSDVLFGRKMGREDWIKFLEVPAVSNSIALYKPKSSLSQLIKTLNIACDVNVQIATLEIEKDNKQAVIWETFLFASKWIGLSLIGLTIQGLIIWGIVELIIFIVKKCTKETIDEEYGVELDVFLGKQQSDLRAKEKQAQMSKARRPLLSAVRQGHDIEFFKNISEHCLEADLTLEHCGRVMHVPSMIMMVNGCMGFVPGHVVAAGKLISIVIEDIDRTINEYKAEELIVTNNYSSGDDKARFIFPKNRPIRRVTDITCHFGQKEQSCDKGARLMRVKSRDGTASHFVLEASNIAYIKSSIPTTGKTVFDEESNGFLKGYYRAPGGLGSEGFCAYPWVSYDARHQNNCIIGMHIAQIGRDSLIVPITTNDFIVRATTQGFFYGVPQGCAFADVYESEIKDQVDVKRIPGTMAFANLKKKSYSSKETELEPSLISKYLDVPNNQLPCKLAPFEKDGILISPLDKAHERLEKKIKVHDFVTQCYNDIPEQCWKGFVHRPEDFEYRVLTIEEAVFGNEEIPSIDFSTSVGFPGILHGKTRKKLIDVERKWIDPNLIAEIRKLEEVHYAGSPLCVVVDTQKDELRKVKRVENGETRLFGTGSLAHFVLCRMYMGRIVESSKSCRVAGSCAIGTNVHSYDWASLFHKAFDKDWTRERVFALDIKGHDVSIAKETGILFGKFLTWYSGRKDLEHFFTTLVYGVVTAYHVTGGTVYQVFDGNPSGWYGTSLLASFDTHVSFNVTYMYGKDYRGLPGEEFDKEVSLIDYGDDNFGTVSEKAEWFDQPFISENMLKLFSKEATTADKEKVSKKWCPPEDQTFLSRKFDVSMGILRAPLELESINGMLHWTRTRKLNKQQKQEYIEQNITQAQMELMHHGKQVYDEYLTKIRAACAEIGFIPTLNTYEHWYRRWLTGYSK